MKVLAEREYECGQLRDKLTTADKMQADLRSELSTSEDRHRNATENLKAERTQIAGQLARAQKDHASAQEQLAALKREAEQTWAAERVENALLRERINDIAAEIARLTAALEGQSSPIEAILAGAPLEPAKNLAPGAAENDNKGNLADRIRALQTRASRVQQPN
jgi:seryl-tRNA synthetase